MEGDDQIERRTALPCHEEFHQLVLKPYQQVPEQRRYIILVPEGDATQQPRSAPPVTTTGKYPMTITPDEFKRWLMSFDFDNDGRISLNELRAAMESRGVWFSYWKSRLGMSQADVDGSGYIEEHEIHYLLDFAEKYMGFRFY